MPNDNVSDNLLSPRALVAGPTATNWTGATLTTPDGSRYVRGTVELLSGFTDEPSIGMIESCEFAEIGQEEELGDGACGVEAYDQYELGWKVDVTARFPLKTNPPRKGDIFSLRMPEGTQAANVRLRFVCTESSRSWGEKSIRKCKFSGKIHNNLIKQALVAARIAGNADVDVLASVNSPAPTAEFGDSQLTAAGVLTSNGTNVTDNDTATLGSTVYRFKNTMAAAYDVQIGSSAANTLANLRLAILATGVSGTNYYAATLVHPTVTVTAITSTTLVVAAITAGSAGNSIATTDTAATLSWGAVTLTGGIN